MHWFSIVNAVIIVLTLGAILAVILVRSLRADLSRYNEERQSLVEGGLEDVEVVSRRASPFSPFPRLVRGVPFHASVVVFELHPVFADGCQRNARMDAREAQIEVPSVFTATSVNALRKRARNARQRCSSISCKHC